MRRWREIGEAGGGGATLAPPASFPASDQASVGLLALLALVAATVASVAVVAPWVGIDPPVPVLLVIAAGAVAVHRAPEHAFEITALAGAVALAAANPPYALFHSAMVGLLFLSRRGTFALAAVLGLLSIWLPKHLFSAHYHHRSAYYWINDPSLALVLFVTACWWRARRDDRLPPAGETASPLAWAAMYLFPGHVLNPMVFSPGDVYRRRGLELRGIAASLLLIAVKGAAHVAIARSPVLGTLSYGALDGARLAVLSRPELWVVVAVGYVDLVLTLSGTADVAVLLARLYGWPMPSPFRYALLAWNPVELWRRWGIYNRKVLLALVYFPLGGGRRHRTRNIMLTFLASALLLHSGWFGSKYWEVGAGGWRDQTVYFLLQGLLVCGWMLVRDRTGDGARPDDHTLRLSWSRAAGTAATQAASALVHVIVLARALPFGDRFEMIARCLGLR